MPPIKNMYSNIGADRQNVNSYSFDSEKCINHNVDRSTK